MYRSSQLSFSQRLQIIKTRRAAERRVRFLAEAVRLLAAIGFLSALIILIVPAVTSARGYFGIGGEWLAMFIAAVLFWSWLGSEADHDD